MMMSVMMICVFVLELCILGGILHNM